MKPIICCLLAFVAACSSNAVQAQGWGTLTGKIVVDGDVPKVPNLVERGAPGVKDGEICAVSGVPDDSLVVSPDGELANCFVYLYLRRGTPDIHPDLKTPAEPNVTFDNVGCRFEPHVLTVRTDQVVNCINTDACGHNVHTFPLKNNAHNMLVSGGDKKGVDLGFNQSELLPIQVKCDIHPWMTAYWLISDHPYATTSGKDGTFKIEKLPAGKHSFRIWHERTGYIERSLDIEIVDGQTTDLGTLKVKAKDLQK